jgi:hypothetical protein
MPVESIARLMSPTLPLEKPAVPTTLQVPFTNFLTVAFQDNEPSLHAKYGTPEASILKLAVLA